MEAIMRAYIIFRAVLMLTLSILFLIYSIPQRTWKNYYYYKKRLFQSRRLMMIILSKAFTQTKTRVIWTWTTTISCFPPYSFSEAHPTALHRILLAIRRRYSLLDMRNQCCVFWWSSLFSWSLWCRLQTSQMSNGILQKVKKARIFLLFFSIYSPSIEE